LAAVIMLGVSAVVVWRWRSKPYLLVGWGWFVGTLVPTIGLISAGAQSMADRFVYVPAIGLFILLAWGVGSTVIRWRWPKTWVGIGTVMVLAACGARTHDQLQYWQDSATLFTHALAVTEGNYVAHDCLGDALYHQGRVDEAIAHYQQVLEIRPDYAETHINYGVALRQQGQPGKAMIHFQQALEIQPNSAETHCNLGAILRRQGQLENAVAHLQKALALQPDFFEAHGNLGIALFESGRTDEAIAHFTKASELRPGDAFAHFNLGHALLKSGRVDEAIMHFQKTLALRPDHAQAKKDLALALRKQSQSKEAVAP
jgi:protein O-mannosyl-transferase